MRGEQYRKPVEEGFPEILNIGGVVFEKRSGLRYGWNPGQPAAFYREINAQGPCLGNMEVLQENSDKKLGYINLEDAGVGLRMITKLHSVYATEKVVSVIKHCNPSGVAKANTLMKAFSLAWNCNSLSAFGGVVCLSDTVDESMAKLLASKEYFIEVIVAPGYSDKARELLSVKKDLRLIKVGELNKIDDVPIEYKRVPGGLLVQQRYETRIISRDKLEVVSLRAPTEFEFEASIFNWIVCGFVRSNSIVIGDKNQTIGIGSGQQSRIDSFRLAAWYANNRSKLGCKGKVAASDAFFPASDCIEMAAEEGITAIVYTLGSIKDKEVIGRANEKNIAMLVTNERCFTH